MAEIKKTKITDIIQDDRNLNKGTEQGKQMITKSLQKFGAGRSILIDKNNRIIAGNKTHENAQELGMDDVLVVETDGSQLVAVKRTDIDIDTAKGREMALADNATVKVDLQWDEEQMKSVSEDYGLDMEEWGVELDDSDDELLDIAESKISSSINYLEFGKNKIPITEDELEQLEQRLEEYKNKFEIIYGFVNYLLHGDN